MPTYSVTESNAQPTSLVTGTLSPGAGAFSVLGIERAGTSGTGTGQLLQGTYGSLLLNADGSFSYQLNNSDPDTDVLGAGMSALERFTYTFSLNGVVATQVLNFQVSGIDEVGQVVSTPDTSLRFLGDGSIDALQQVRSTAQTGILADFAPPLTFTNNGALLVDAGPYSSNGYWSNGFFNPHTMVNNGLIEVVGHYNQANGVGIADGTFTNNGVVRVVADRVANPNSGSFAGQARAVGAPQVINTGTIEASSTAGLVFGVTSRLIDNSGFITVSGNASLDWVRAVDTSLTGAMINNRGTIQAVSTGGGQTTGIRLFADGTNVHTFGTVNNSGAIVADVAIRADAGYSTGLHVNNSGRIEGDVVAQSNMNIITNTAAGSLIGNVTFGLDHDMVFNQGLISGTVDLGGGVNLYDGRGGAVGAQVVSSGAAAILFGGSGNDRLQVTSGASRIEGGGGADILTGGSGRDVFVYTAASDSSAAAADTINAFQAGVDKIDLSALSPISLTFTANGSFTDVGAVTATGTLLIRVIGTVGAGDVITSAAGTSAMGTAGDDLLFAQSPGSDLNGSGGTDVLFGGAGANRVDGGSGGDVMFGGEGDDTYIVDNGNDRVLEREGGGTDTVITFVDYSLQAFVENGILAEGAGNIGLLGNALDNVLTGNSGSNILRGGAGRNVLMGGLGSDLLEGTGGSSPTGLANSGQTSFVYRSASESTPTNPDYITAFAKGRDIIDLSALSPVAYRFTEYQNYNIGFDIYAGIINHWTKVDITLASGAMMQVWIANQATLAAFNVNAPMSGTGIDDTLIGSTADNVIDGQGGNDTLTGGAGADRLTGYAGNDTFKDSAAGLNGDTITDLGVGDRILITDANAASFTFSLSGNVLTYSGGSLTLESNPDGRIVAQAAAGGGVQLLVLPPEVRNDLNGDGRSDLLLRNVDGRITDWLGEPAGTFFSNHLNALYSVPTEWKIAATADFNGDGKADILYRNDNGSITQWLGSGNGQFTWNQAASYTVDAAWTVAASGDFNGDGRADIVLRNSNGLLTEWLGKADGTFFSNDAIATYSLPTDWKVAGAGDFNGDGRSDLLLRNNDGRVTEWLGQSNGTFLWNAAATYALGTDWKVAGIGDVNGDGRDDLVLHNASAGLVVDWLGEPGGTFFSNHAATSYALPQGWNIAAVGDYNGDGRADLALRNDNGLVTEWLGTNTGGFDWNSQAVYNLDPSWQIF